MGMHAAAAGLASLRPSADLARTRALAHPKIHPLPAANRFPAVDAIPVVLELWTVSLYTILCFSLVGGMHVQAQ